MSIKAVIFDMGGVIIRTENQAPRRKLAERFGITPEQLGDIFFDSETAAKATLGEVTVQQHRDAVARALNLPDGEIAAVWDEFWAGDQVDMLLVNFLRALRPHYKIGLLSNAWSDMRRVLTDQWHIIDAFDDAVISAEVGVAKPDHQIYHLILSHLGVRPDEAVFVDDFLRNIVAAQAVGLHTVHFRNQQQALSALQEILDADV